MSPSAGLIWLASASARRRHMLDEAGIDSVVRPADIDDGRLRPGRVPPAHWVMALAYLKGRRVADALAERDGLVLAADTVCVLDGMVLGQPPDAAAARGMLAALRGREHRTMTGVCLIPLDSRRRFLFVDAATVGVGGIDDAELDRYVRSEEWRGKAGGYNYADRLAAGWPIECAGDPTTVMGLPMRRLSSWINRARSAR